MASTTPTINLDAIIREMVRHEVARVLGAIAGPTYTTEPGTWPPGARSHRQARDRIRAVSGHVRSGKGKATRWSVSVSAYQAHHASRPATVLHVAATTDEQIATAALDGFRATRRKTG